MKRLTILALVLVICTCASAEMPKFTPPDPRLDKKATLDVNHVKLEEVAQSLSEQTDITIKAGSGERDWKVRQQRVTIHAKDLPVGKMLAEVARLLGFYVSREGKAGEWTYIIWQDKKSRDLEAEMLTAQKEGAAKRIKDMRQGALDEAQKALGMTPDQAMKLKDSDPLAAYLGGTKSGRGWSAMLSSLSSQFPTEYDLMMRGKRSYIPLSGLPSGLQQSVNDAVSGGLAKQIKQQSGDAGKNLTPHQLVILPFEEFNDAQGGGGAGMLGMSGMMFITSLPADGKPGAGGPFGGGQPITMFPMISPTSGAANLFGEGLLALETGESMQDVSNRLGPKFQNQEFLAQALAKDSPTEKSPPTDPELTREVEIKAENMPAQNLARGRELGNDQDGQGKALAEISRALGEPVFFESFNRMMPIAVFIKAGKQPVYKVLVGLEKGGYSWERGESTLRVRSSNWAQQRSYAIPDSYIAYYKGLLDKQGALTLDDLASIATSLTDDQIQRTLLQDPDLNLVTMSLAGGTIGGSRDVLRLYGTFTADQKQALETDDGVAFGRLTDAQWDLTNKIITDQQGGIYVADGSIRMLPLTESQRKVEMLSRTFEIKAQVNGEKDPRKITVAVHVMGKAEVAQIRESRRKALEAAQKPQAPPKPGQAPAPAQPDPDK